jgi:hypothetical protein
LEDLNVDERVILDWIFKKYDGDVDWIDLAHGRDFATWSKSFFVLFLLALRKNKSIS